MIQKELAEVETFEYDPRGRLKGMRTQQPLVFRYLYGGLASAQLTTRLDELGNRYDYTYDNHDLLVEVTGPGGWRVQLVEGSPKRLIRDGALILEFP